MSDTPLTDARVVFFGYNPEEGDEFVQADFARDLERQNTALKADKERLLSSLLICRNALFIENEHARSKAMRADAKLPFDYAIEDADAAIDAARKPWGDDAIMRQHIDEGGTPT